MEGKLVGEITREDVNKIFMADCTKKLSSKTIKAVLQAVTIPMKWAHLHDLTENNCYSGIISPRSKPKKKTILTLEETKALFNAEWDNDRVKLACLVACFTGMREGEIPALQVQDKGDLLKLIKRKPEAIPASSFFHMGIILSVQRDFGSFTNSNSSIIFIRPFRNNIIYRIN